MWDKAAVFRDTIKTPLNLSVRPSICLYYNKLYLQRVVLLHIIPLRTVMSLPKTNDIRAYRTASECFKLLLRFHASYSELDFR